MARSSPRTAHKQENSETVTAQLLCGCMHAHRPQTVHNRSVQTHACMQCTGWLHGYTTLRLGKHMHTHGWACLSRLPLGCKLTAALPLGRSDATRHVTPYALTANASAGLPQQHGMIGYCRLHQLLAGKGNESRARGPKSLRFVLCVLGLCPISGHNHSKPPYHRTPRQQHRYKLGSFCVT